MTAVVGLPMDEFNDMLSREDLTEEQLNLCRDIRYYTANKRDCQYIQEPNTCSWVLDEGWRNQLTE